MFIKQKSAQNSISDINPGKRKALIAFATYGTLDRDGDRANKGMFSKSWQEFKDVRLFENHDKTKAPGKIEKMWDDSEHAYAEVRLGTHTLGEDVLKQMDEGIITDSSYTFLPTKYTKIQGGKGYNYTEGFHKEVSVLTHWGAHPESKVINVEKSAKELFHPEVLKQLSTDELTFITQYINDENQDLVQLAQFASTLDVSSDLYTWVNDVISSTSYTISRFKSMLSYYGTSKEWAGADEAKERLTKLKSFCRNTTASDECIQNIMKEAEALESLLAGTEAAAEKTKALQQQDEGDAKSQIQLMNLNMLLTR